MKAIIAITVTVLCMGEIFMATSQEAQAVLPGNKLVGRWRGGDTNGLNCLAVFDGQKARFHTFRGTQHVSTVESRYRISENGTNVTLGVSGEARVTAADTIQLALRPQNKMITVLGDVTVHRIAEAPKGTDPK